ncbi:unnamed protein product [Symbiodinium natans]|uniref:Uncharacterized protein n=1 Tax=Symbiodinium natans TaxID=878477 RepID=A0A812JKU6_9DINO|nr:unnamed protein product [Symbiodinium natans]
MTSIEFRPVCSFSSPLSTQRSRRSAPGATASCCLIVAQRGLLFAGLSDGKILAWEIDRNCADRRAKESKARVLEEHKGDVRSLIFVESLCQGVMISGAADRCIKMWDLSDPRTGIQCVQSLYGHGGTVIALEHGSDLLLSSSTDGLLFVWRDASPARLLRFPAYAVRQRLEPHAGTRAKETWFLSLSMREGEAPTLFAGDSEGYVHIFKLDLTQDKASEQLFLAVWKAKVHDLGVSKIMAVPMESFLFTLSYDQKLKAMDSVTGQVLFEELNQCNVIFHSLAWDSASQDVIVCDSKGNLGFYNLIQESWVTWKNVTDESIIDIHLLPAISRLVLLTPHSIQVLDVVRGVKFQEIKEHTAPIVAIASRPTSQGGVLYTASMDNTIRMWDSDTLECIKCLKERKQEITAMVYVPRANVVITGHENSDLKMWSLDSHQEACLRTVTGQPVHENTISALILVNVQAESAHDDPTGTGFELVVAGSYDRQLSFWRVTLTSDGTAMAKFERVFLAHQDATDEILALGHSPFGSIFSGGNEGIIRQWTIWGGKASEADLVGHEDAVTSFATDGYFLFSGSADCSVRIWECTHGRQMKIVRLHDVPVQALVVIPDTGIIASCGGDGRLVFWDSQLGSVETKLLRTYEQPEEFRTLSYVNLNNSLLVGCESGKIIAFPLPAGLLDKEPKEPEVFGGHRGTAFRDPQRFVSGRLRRIQERTLCFVRNSEYSSSIGRV